MLNAGIAASTRYAGNFNDTEAEGAYKVNDYTNRDRENLAVYYNLDEGPLIIKGVKYMYVNYGPGTGPYEVTIGFRGDNLYVEYIDSGIPNVGFSPSWRTFRCLGPTYLIDDNPLVRFIGRDPSDNCIALCCDTPSIGNSLYYVAHEWMVDPDYEYIVELIYEWIVPMDVGDLISNFISSTDYVDAYFITLSAGITYEFKLDRRSGSGNLDMRLVTYQDLTNNVLAQSNGTSDPEYMRYTPSSSTTYVLLIEPNTHMTDTISYSVSYTIDKYISDADAINEINLNRYLAIISITLACLGLVLTVILISISKSKKNSSQHQMRTKYTGDNVKGIPIKSFQEFCTYCGYKFNKSDRFCSNCGKEKYLRNNLDTVLNKEK